MCIRDRDNIQQEIAQLREEFQIQKAKWDDDKRDIEDIQSLRQQIEDVNHQIERAQREYDLNKVAELQYGTPVSYTHLMYKNIPSQ